jgi:hypothetical protein
MLGALTLFTGAAIWHACPSLGERRAFASVACAAAAAVWFNFSRYEHRSDYIRDLTMRRDRREVALTDALRDASTPRDVVLGSLFISLQVVGPAGRKAVAVGAMWSNPYISLRARQRDQEASATRSDSGSWPATTASRVSSAWGMSAGLQRTTADARDIALGFVCLHGAAPSAPGTGLNAIIFCSRPNGSALHP